MKTYTLKAYRGREYDLNTGWDFSDYPEYVSGNFRKKERALAHVAKFTNQLPLNEVWGIQLVTDDDVEMVDIVDYSQMGYRIGISQEYGQYMIAKGRYRLHWLTYRYAERLTRNAWLTRPENKSFSWNLEEVFKTESEARQWLEERGITNYQDQL